MLSQREFREISEMVYRESGITLNSEKKKLVEARLGKRLRALGIASVPEYIKLVKRDQGEKIRFLDTISTNHTFFFREKHHFDCLAPKHKKIWCTACSSGEEPYSIAIHCLEKGFSPYILASDISTEALGTAIKGIYPLKRVKEISPNLLRKYFKKGIGRWEGFVRVKPVLRSMVTFKRYNLLNGSLPPEQFDVIFCRNVLIYFDSTVKEKVVNRLYSYLKNGGYFIIGGAESLTGLSHPYKYIRPSIYQKISD